MIPKFPEFKNVALEDRVQIEVYTSRYQPFSDFNFTSLWLWDTDGKRAISELNGNLVVRFTDYHSNAPFLSFLGDSEVEETARQLIEYAKVEGMDETLHLVPAMTAMMITGPSFFVEEDKDNFDHVFSAAKLSFLYGQEFKEKRHLAERFKRENPDAEFLAPDAFDVGLHDEILTVFHQWKNDREHKHTKVDVENERKALLRLKEHDGNRLLFSGVKVGGRVVGFGIDELLHNQHAISHFFKTDSSITGLGEFLNMRIAWRLLANDVIYWNWEQDLGMDNLRRSKMSYRPVDFFKKYRVSLKKDE